MNALGDLFHHFLDYLGRLWPLTVIDPWETGVRVRLGQKTRTLGPGWYWVWPFIDVVYTIETNTEVFNTGKQTIDGVTVETVGAFRLVDAARYFTELNDDPVVAVGYAVGAEVSRALTEGAWRGATEERLRTVLRRARTRCRRWGIRLDWIEFRTVTECPSLRLLQDTAPPTIIAQGDK